MGKAQKKETLGLPPKEEKVQKKPQEIIDDIAFQRRQHPLYSEGLRAFRNGESVCILPTLENELPIEWLYGFIDGMASEVRSR